MAQNIVANQRCCNTVVDPKKLTKELTWAIAEAEGKAFDEAIETVAFVFRAINRAENQPSQDELYEMIMQEMQRRKRSLLGETLRKLDGSDSSATPEDSGTSR